MVLKGDSNQALTEIRCPLCENINQGDLYLCSKCGTWLKQRPFLSQFQLEPCTCKDCSNKTVNIRSPICMECKEEQRASIRKYLKCRFLDLYTLLFRSKQDHLSVWKQFELYIGLVLGVYFSNRVRDTPGINEDTLAKNFLVASLLAIAIMPIVYEKINFSSQSPFILRMSFYFQSGVFSDIILASFND